MSPYQLQVDITLSRRSDMPKIANEASNTALQQALVRNFAKYLYQKHLDICKIVKKQQCALWGCFLAKTSSLGGELIMKSANFENENLFLGHFTLGEVHSIDLQQMWCGNSWYMWRWDQGVQFDSLLKKCLSFKKYISSLFAGTLSYSGNPPHFIRL